VTSVRGFHLSGTAPDDASIDRPRKNNYDDSRDQHRYEYEYMGRRTAMLHLHLAA
jgi:hypothetical protein